MREIVELTWRDDTCQQAACTARTWCLKKPQKIYFIGEIITRLYVFFSYSKRRKGRQTQTNYLFQNIVQLIRAFQLTSVSFKAFRDPGENTSRPGMILEFDYIN